ncbi:MAG: hypothetical protein VX833_00045 [Actinomycetota bacterium]|nr:hypothetical protein [Actinomycetota bacterium]
MGGGFGLGEGTSLTVRNRRTPRPLVFTVVLAVAACGSSDPQLVDPEALERSIPRVLLPTAPELVEQVSCPPMDAERLSTVSCTVTIAGYPILVTVTGPDPFNGVRVSAEDSLVWASDLADRAGERLDADLGPGNSVVCEPVARVAKAGQIFDCAVAGSDGQSRSLVATVLDATGSFRLEVQDG